MSEEEKIEEAPKDNDSAPTGNEGTKSEVTPTGSSGTFTKNVSTSGEVTIKQHEK